MHLYHTSKGILIHYRNEFFTTSLSWDELVNRSRLFDYLNGLLLSDAKALPESQARQWINHQLLPPVGSQELWAAGVTYLRSRDARMEESRESGASDCYQQVYDAERPELFFKSQPHRIAASGTEVYIRADSTWNVPEPEFTLYINSAGDIQGYTIGNDMSSRSIEGENPLYLPQAKIYERSAALGPCLWVSEKPPESSMEIAVAINRNSREVFSGSISLSRMKRRFEELAGWLYRGMRFEKGCYLMTGTGIVPPHDFTLMPDDEVVIQVKEIGELRNRVSILPTD